MAAIYFVGLGDFACGAIIINNNFVLTLNECVRPDENNPVYNSKILVVVGDQHVETGNYIKRLLLFTRREFVYCITIITVMMQVTITRHMKIPTK